MRGKSVRGERKIFNEVNQINPIPTLLRRIVLLLPFNPRDALRRILTKSAKNPRIILDASTGQGGNIIVTSYHNPSIRTIGFDIFPPYVMECKALGVYDGLLIADVRHPPFKDKSVDATYFTETIEHLEKRDGIESLEKLERVTRKAILVTTPIGLTLRSKEEIKNGNIFQLHCSGWLPEEFIKRGYAVWGRYPSLLQRFLILLFFFPFSIINLVPLPLEKSIGIIALKKFNK